MQYALLKLMRHEMMIASPRSVMCQSAPGVVVEIVDGDLLKGMRQF